jgi:hypothetical protein
MKTAICIILTCTLSFLSAAPPHPLPQSLKTSIPPITPKCQPLFASDDILDLTLTADFKALHKDIEEVRSYHPGILSFTDKNNKPVTIDVQLKTRGYFRRNPRVCDSPPLNVKFDAAQIPDTVFAGLSKIKLVTHCKRNDKDFNDFVLLEYLVYKLYNLFTDKSLKVRLVRITYRNTGKNSGLVTRFAFFIEDIDDLAARFGGKEVQNKWSFGIFKKMNKKDLAMQAVFHFMIGNRDWSVEREHNVKLIALDNEKRICAIPYDFDMTGIVNPYYVWPHSKDHVRDLVERFYQGFCSHRVLLPEIFMRFKELKREIYSLYKNFQPLKKGARKKALRYLDQFYRIIGNSRLIDKFIHRKCRQLPSGYITAIE